ncbi:MAG: NupC/NupG family nucleoside CNT transporter [Planctomycetaceae bacterium]|nr:NupC/NupG family nucleoside CNT transporter [Planctomycetaceae bacterium]
MLYLRCLVGILFFCAACWALSSDRRRFPWRVVAGGVALQFAIAWVILRTSGGERFFKSVADGVTKLISMAMPGAEMVFGNLAKPDGPAGFVFAFAGTGLVVIVFFSALMSILYYLGIMQVVVWALARGMTTLLGVSGAESMAMAANVFIGQSEAPLVIKPYIARMTRSELVSLMCGGFATIAGSVMAVYMGLLGNEYGPHLLTASVMSAPAAFVCAKILQPETEVSQTAGKVELRIERGATNVIEAASNGTTDGLKLWWNVIAMLIAFVALVHLVDWILGAVAAGLTLGQLFGYVFAPVAWLMGVDGWHDCQMFGGLLGTKVAINEFVAYQQLVNEVQPGAASAFEHARSAKMAAYALCGFANFASIGIQIGGISALAPERKTDLAQLAPKAMLGGAFASWMTATIAGVYL